MRLQLLPGPGARSGCESRSARGRWQSCMGLFRWLRLIAVSADRARSLRAHVLSPCLISFIILRYDMSLSSLFLLCESPCTIRAIPYVTLRLIIVIM